MTTETPILNIIGAQVALGPHRRDLLPLYLRWINDFEVRCTTAGRVGPMTMESEEDWFNRTARDTNNMHFTIYEKETLRPIGTTSLHAVHHYHRSAEFGIMIGEKDCWGKGYGTETTRLMLHYGFINLGLHNIMLRVYGFNDRAIRVYTKAGFQEIGRRREALRTNGQVHDEIFMDCLATEFSSHPLPYSGT